MRSINGEECVRVICSCLKLGFPLLSFESSLYILETSLISDNVVFIYFLPVNISHFDEVLVFTFVFHVSCFRVVAKKSLSKPRPQKSSPTFSS